LANFSVVLDANVLYPAPLRDVLVQMSLEGVYRARWTDQIHDEWIRNVHQNQGISRDILERVRQKMNDAIPDCLITGYEPLIPSLKLPDPDDRHVLAAAIKENCSVIVTMNLKDFPEQELVEKFGIEPQHPDDFLMYQSDLAQEKTIGAMKAIRSRLRKPPKTAEEFIDTMQWLRLPQFAERLRKYKDFF
jgi:hypothetical protein